jgi:UDP-N-acetylmuramate dehydrogenase
MPEPVSAIAGAPRRAVSLREYNTLALECVAAACIDLPNPEALGPALDWCDAQGLRPLPLGEASNVLLPEQLGRAVLHSTDCSLVELRRDAAHVWLRAGAGLNWHRLVCECLERGLHGLENLALIPGTVGAAPVQNIGAYGVEVAQFLVAVHGVYLDDRSAFTLAADECGFAYRHSRFKADLRGRCMITALDLRLALQPTTDIGYPALAQRLQADGAVATPRSVFEAVVSLRRERLPDPKLMPNAGSFFTNPLLACDAAERLRERYPSLPVYRTADAALCKLSAAWMIEHCGLRGLREGGVGVAPQHALVLVNYGGGRAALLRLAARIQEAVHERFGCVLAIEPEVISSD